jgi:hypothetical protein
MKAMRKLANLAKSIFSELWTLTISVREIGKHLFMKKDKQQVW